MVTDLSQTNEIREQLDALEEFCTDTTSNLAVVERTQQLRALVRNRAGHLANVERAFRSFIEYAAEADSNARLVLRARSLRRELFYRLHMSEQVPATVGD